MKRILLPFITIISLMSCTSTDSEVVKNEVTEALEEVIEEEVVEINMDSIANQIDEFRVNIETTIEEPLSVGTENLREKIKQKWEKIHFYTMDGKVVRVKSYPYAQISERTEEFYFQNESLVLVVIQDNGLNEKRGSESENLDKILYFNNGELFAEKGEKVTEEYENMKAEEAELLQEAEEYLTIYKSKSTEN